MDMLLSLEKYTITKFHGLSNYIWNRVLNENAALI